MQNPYAHRSMIRDPEAFFGRQKELARLYALLGGMQSVSVVGERRIGKSSLLYCSRLPQLQTRVPGYDFTGHVFTYVDLAKLPRLTPTAFLHRLLEELRRADERVGRLQLKGQVGPGEFEDFIDVVNGKGLKPVFLLDEFDSVARAGEFDVAFFDFLRSLANGKDLAFVTVSTRRLPELCHASVVSSPFFNIFAVIPLGVLERDEALELIERPSAKADCSLAEEAGFLLGLTGRHPFFLQIACFYLLEAKAKGVEVEYEAVARLFYDEADDHFAYLWQHLGDEEKQGIWRALEARKGDYEYELLESSAFRQFVEERRASEIKASTEMTKDLSRNNFGLFPGGTPPKHRSCFWTTPKDKPEGRGWIRRLARGKFFVGIVIIIASIAVALLLDVTEALLVIIGTIIALIIDELRNMRERK